MSYSRRKRTIPLAEHFWSKVQKTPACWLWQATRRPAGYGTYYINRYPALAHRVAWELTYGPIPKGLHVCHSCDNPPCVRPEHLFLGSQTANLRDAHGKGRLVKTGLPGDSNPAARLSTEDVLEIRRLAAAGPVNKKELGRRFGVSHTTIRGVIERKTWKHIP